MYDFTIEHRPGRGHGNADALTRRPRRRHGSYPSCGDFEYITATFLQQNREKEDASKTVEDEFSWTSNEIAQAQRSDPGINPVIARMEEGKPQATFWQPGLVQTVKDHVAACLPCAECSPRGKIPRAPLHPIRSSYPFQ